MAAGDSRALAAAITSTSLSRRSSGYFTVRERIFSEFLRRPFAEEPGPLAGEERSRVRVRGGDGDVGGGNAGSRRRQRANVSSSAPAARR